MSQARGREIRTVCCFGVGLIGGGWAAHFLRAGLRVRAYDQRPEARQQLYDQVRHAWPTLEKLGLAKNASPDRLSFTTNLDEAIDGVDFVQESAIEDEALKIRLLADLDARLAPEIIVASSSAGFLADSLRRDCQSGGRILVGHPFNPPYLVPLVEVVGGEGGDPVQVARAVEFYRSVGSHPIVLRKEIPGYIANRIQNAVFKEILYLLESGVASVAEIDDAITYGPAIRWAVNGPSRIFYLGASDAARYDTFVDSLADALEQGHIAPDAFRITRALRGRYIEDVAASVGGKSRQELERVRDDGVVRVRHALSGPGRTGSGV